MKQIRKPHFRSLWEMLLICLGLLMCVSQEDLKILRF